MSTTLNRRALLKGIGASALLSQATSTLAKVLGYPRAMQGPMIGAPGPNHVTVWVRASGEFDVRLEVATDRDFRKVLSGASARANARDDYCVVLRADNLLPATTYYYRLRYDGQLDKFQPLPHKTTTAPAEPADFRVAFGSCCRVQYDNQQRIFAAVQKLEPDLFLWLGDNIYADSDQPHNIADLYRRGRVVDHLVPLLRSTPQLAIWDDHDFGFNDSDGSNPIKPQALEVFKNYWANPSYGEADNPGIYFKQSYGGVDFFFLDGRYHRDDSDAKDGPAKTMLGARQKAWLKAALLSSTAPFKILVSGTGWSSAEKEKGGDSWAVFMHERNEIFDFIRDKAVSGVVCISGDSHMGELNCIPRSQSGGYDIYDFCSSPLAQMPASKFTRQVPEVRVRDVWSRSENVGVISFTMSPEPTLTYTLHDIQGESVWKPLVLRRKDLSNGARTWDRLSDPGELKRLERHRQGRGYYGIDPA
ncbi:MAG: alkaline phosphatase D family protein [Betaproteobacteria bacterium]|nr:alkaline phosphatase D family protein [Betaproteobacteria bacterium]